jgi:hypothetical protein
MLLAQLHQAQHKVQELERNIRGLMRQNCELRKGHRRHVRDAPTRYAPDSDV